MCCIFYFSFVRSVLRDMQSVQVLVCNNGSIVHGCFLDASKAFDRVDHSLLFRKLLQRRLSPVVVRILLSWYMNQWATVLWNGSLSLMGFARVVFSLLFCS